MSADDPLFERLTFGDSHFGAALSDNAKKDDHEALLRAYGAANENDHIVAFSRSCAITPLMALIGAALFSFFLLSITLPLVHVVSMHGTDRQRSIIVQCLSAGIMMTLFAIFSLVALIALRATVSEDSLGPIRRFSVSAFRLKKFRVLWIRWRLVILASLAGVPPASTIASIVPADTEFYLAPVIAAVRRGEALAPLRPSTAAVRSVMQLVFVVSLAVFAVIIFLMFHLPR